MPRKASFFYLSLILLTAGCASVESDQAREEDHAAKRANAENTAKLAPPHTRQPQEAAVDANLPTIQPKVSSCDEGSLSLRELEVEVLRVSNNEPTHIFQTLGVMGYSTLQIEGQGQSNNFANGISCDELPIVMLPMLPDASRLAVADRPSGGSYGNTGTANLSESHGKTFSGEVDHLFAFYHPEEVESVETLKRLIYERLDLPAQQIYIEAVILEISSERLKELGVNFNDIGSNILSMGAFNAVVPNANNIDPTFGYINAEYQQQLSGNAALPEEGIYAGISALLANGAAEILSKPSILALNNREARIEIVDIISYTIESQVIPDNGRPIISSSDYKEVRPGITLDLKPRTSVDNRFVSMEIDVSVEQITDGDSGTTVDTLGNIVSEKPGTSFKRVQTFARIPDRTPIIIGGLVGQEERTVVNSVPGLGAIPVMGKLFGAEKEITEKREVVIVITPYIVGSHQSNDAQSRPKDSEVMKVEDTIVLPQ